jgi:hypothetical protein
VYKRSIQVFMPSPLINSRPYRLAKRFYLGPPQGVRRDVGEYPPGFQDERHERPPQMSGPIAQQRLEPLGQNCKSNNGQSINKTRSHLRNKHFRHLLGIVANPTTRLMHVCVSNVGTLLKKLVEKSLAPGGVIFP